MQVPSGDRWSLKAIRRPNHFGGIFLALIVALLTYASLTPFNPDWLSYLYIFENRGAWLADQGRDLAFVLTNEIGASIFGADGYWEFRIAIACMFVVFAFFLGSGRLLPTMTSAGSSWPFLLSCTTLLAVRFTIQIREGLALAIFLVALAATCRINTRSFTYILSAVVVGVLAVLMHFGMAIVFFALVLVIFSRSFDERIFRQVIIAGLAISILALLLYILIDRSSFIQIFSFHGGRERIQADWSASYFLYWAIYGALSGRLSYRVLKLTAGESSVIARYEQIIAGPLLCACLIVIYISIFARLDTLTMNSFIRIFHLLLMLSLVFLARRTRARLLVSLTCGFILLDQGRSVVEAIAMYGDMLD